MRDGRAGLDARRDGDGGRRRHDPRRRDPQQAAVLDRRDRVSVHLRGDGVRDVPGVLGQRARRGPRGRRAGVPNGHARRGGVLRDRGHERGAGGCPGRCVRGVRYGHRDFRRRGKGRAVQAGCANSALARGDLRHDRRGGRRGVLGGGQIGAAGRGKSWLGCRAGGGSARLGGH